MKGKGTGDYNYRGYPRTSYEAGPQHQQLHARVRMPSQLLIPLRPSAVAFFSFHELNNRTWCAADGYVKTPANWNVKKPPEPVLGVREKRCEILNKTD